MPRETARSACRRSETDRPRRQQALKQWCSCRSTDQLRRGQAGCERAALNRTRTEQRPFDDKFASHYGYLAAMPMSDITWNVRIVVERQ